MSSNNNRYTEMLVKYMKEEGIPQYVAMLEELKGKPLLPTKYCVHEGNNPGRRVLPPALTDGPLNEGPHMGMLYAGMHMAYITQLQKEKIVADCDQCKHRLACLISMDNDDKRIRFEQK